MENKDKLIKRFITEYSGYGKNDPRTGSHLKKRGKNKYISTITCLVHFNKTVVELYESNENKD